MDSLWNPFQGSHEIIAPDPGWLRDPLPFSGFRPLQRGFPTCSSLAFVPSFAEAGREARLKPALFSREYSFLPPAEAGGKEEPSEDG